MNILIVDDDLVDRTHIKRTLRRADTKVHIKEAQNVNDAIDTLKSESFDAILLDYNMPQRNGTELLHEIKQENSIKGSAIIMMSTSEEEEIAMQCLHEGAQDFIAKSDITGFRLKRAILGAKARFQMEEELRKSYEKVKQMAEKDELTQLANRYLFDESLNRAFLDNERGHSHVALLLFDLDHFKYVNDTHGHDIGDILLKNVAKRIHSCLRGTELFARLGGDEFAIILTQQENECDAERVALRILRILKKPFKINDAIVDISASIGIALSLDNADKAIELFKQADIAMYKAKQQGRNQLAFFENAMQVQFLKRYKIEKALNSATITDQLTLHFQPVFSRELLQINGFEALLRWEAHTPPIFPDEFIPIAETCKAINPIGLWVINSACAHLAKWQEYYGRTLKISINLSPIQLVDDALLPHIIHCLNNYQIKPHLIEFELTETALLEKSGHVLDTINAIGDLGCRIALDDFGTGFSSLSHLHDFPINTVKIDKSLMPQQNDTSKHKLLKGLMAMLHYLDLEVVAEGVETIEQQVFCQDLNIHYLQGFYLSRPLHAIHIENLLEQKITSTKDDD